MIFVGGSVGVSFVVGVVGLEFEELSELWFIYLGIIVELVFSEEIEFFLW